MAALSLLSSNSDNSGERAPKDWPTMSPSLCWRIARAELLASRTMRSEEHTSELQSLMRNTYAVFCLKKKKQIITYINTTQFTTPLTHNTHRNHKADQ